MHLVSAEGVPDMPRDVLLQVRAGTTAQWAAADPVLAIGEPGLDTDLSILKFGDGSHPWSGLEPISGGITAPDKITTRQIPYVPATIVNPGFEADLTGWAEYADELTSSYTISVDSTVYYSGTKSVKIVTGDQYMNVGVSQVMDLENVSALNFFASRESYLVSINVIFTTSSGTTTTVSAGTLSSDGWDDFSVDIPEGYDEKNVTVTIAFYGATTSGVIGYFDDVSLKYSSDDDFFYIADLDTYIGTAFEEYVDSPDKTTVKQVMYRQVTGETGEYAWITDLDTYIDNRIPDVDEAIKDYLNTPDVSETKQVPYRQPLSNVFVNGDAEGASTSPWTSGEIADGELIGFTQDTSEYHEGAKSFKLNFNCPATDDGVSIEQVVDLTDVETVTFWVLGSIEYTYMVTAIASPVSTQLGGGFVDPYWTQYTWNVPEAYRIPDQTVRVEFKSGWGEISNAIIYVDEFIGLGNSGGTINWIEDIDTYFDDVYAPLASPTFTGTPIAPTADADTDTTQIATTAFVLGQASDTNPSMDGAAAAGTSEKYSRYDHVHPTDTSRAASDHNHDTVYSRFRGVSSSTPSDPIAGDIWIDTTSGSVPKIYDGSSWITLT